MEMMLERDQPNIDRAETILSENKMELLQQKALNTIRAKEGQ